MGETTRVAADCWTFSRSPASVLEACLGPRFPFLSLLLNTTSLLPRLFWWKPSLQSFPVTVGHWRVKRVVHAFPRAAGGPGQTSLLQTRSSLHLCHVHHSVRQFRSRRSPPHSFLLFPTYTWTCFSVSLSTPYRPPFLLFTEKIGPQVKEGAGRLKGGRHLTSSDSQPSSAGDTDGKHLAPPYYCA